jgi:hypothetical protein
MRFEHCTGNQFSFLDRAGVHTAIGHEKGLDRCTNRCRTVVSEKSLESRAGVNWPVDFRNLSPVLIGVE